MGYSGELVEPLPGIGFVPSLANVSAFVTTAGLVLVDTGGYLRGSARARKAPGLGAGCSAPHGGLLARPRGPRLRRAALRARGGGERLAGAVGGRPRERAAALRPLPPDGGLQRLDQPAPVRHPRARVAHRLPLPRRDLPPVPRCWRWASERFELHHARGETDDHTWTWVPVARRALLRRPLHLGLAQRRQPAEGAAATPRLGRRAARAWPRSSAEVLLPGHGLPVVGAERVRAGARRTRRRCSSRCWSRRWR